MSRGSGISQKKHYRHISFVKRPASEDCTECGVAVQLHGMPFSSFCQGAVQLKCFSSPFVKESLHSLGKGPVGINPFPVFLIPLGHHRVCFNTPSAAFINDLPGVIKDGFDVVVIAGLCFSIVSSLLCCVDLLFPALPYLPAQSLGFLGSVPP